MIKAVISGAGGRMGEAIIRLIAGDADIELAGAIERKGHPSLGDKMRGVTLSDDIGSVADWDVLVEFASPAAAMAHVPRAADAGRGAVVGTTGFSRGELEHLRSFGAKAPVLISPNMSVGVNILFKLAEAAAKALGEGFDVEIIECHHNKKKDSPSGTAARLSGIIARARGASIEDRGVYGRKGLKARMPGEIGVHAVRGGTITGEHTALFAGESERLEITHRAESRDIFAAGALRAVKFIAGAPPGLYSMEDVIKA